MTEKFHFFQRIFLLILTPWWRFFQYIWGVTLLLGVVTIWIDRWQISPSPQNPKSFSKPQWLALFKRWARLPTFQRWPKNSKMTKFGRDTSLKLLPVKNMHNLQKAVWIKMNKKFWEKIRCLGNFNFFSTNFLLTI